MHQTISVGIVLTIAVLLNGIMAAKMSSDGNWGGAIGATFGQAALFYLIYGFIFLVARFIRGKARMPDFTASRLNYVSAAIVILGMLGGIASRA